MYRLVIAPCFNGTEVQISKYPLMKQWWLWFFTWLPGSIRSVPCLEQPLFLWPQIFCSPLFSLPRSLFVGPLLSFQFLKHARPTPHLYLLFPVPGMRMPFPRARTGPLAPWLPFVFTAGTLHSETFPGHSATCQAALPRRWLSSFPAWLRFFLAFIVSKHIVLVCTIYSMLLMVCVSPVQCELHQDRFFVWFILESGLPDTYRHSLSKYLLT